jgi:hypothetical protein
LVFHIASNCGDICSACEILPRRPGVTASQSGCPLVHPGIRWWPRNICQIKCLSLFITLFLYFLFSLGALIITLSFFLSSVKLASFHQLKEIFLSLNFFFFFFASADI